MRICGQCGTRFEEPIQFCPNDGSPTYEAQAQPVAAEDPLLGRVVDGRYRIEQQIGEGGMGVVYLAVHTVLQKKLALKVLRGDNSKDAEVVQRFMQEAQSATSIGHQNIIDISDFGRLSDGSVYFVMEFLDGTSLNDLIKRGGSVPMADAIHILRQIASALDAAHARGIVHRDLKPDNIFLITQGGDPLFAKVLDFGVAKVGGASSKLTKTGMVFGTPHYMSPEQAAGHSVDARTDIYALGVIMYEMFTGKVPFDADTFMGILSKHMFEAPASPSEVKGAALGALEAVILKALAKGPEERYQSMIELVSDLDTIAAGGTIDVGGRAGVAPPGNLADALEPPGHGEVTVQAAPSSSGGGVAGFALIALALLALLVVGGGVGTAVFFLTADDEGSARAQAPHSDGIVTAAPPEAPSDVGSTGVGSTAVDPTGPAPTPPTPAVAAEQVALIEIQTTPPGAEVLLDGIMVGNTPVSVPRPTQGTQAVLLRLRDHDDMTIQVNEHSSDQLALTLEATRQIARAPSGRRGGRREPEQRPSQPVITPVVSRPPPPPPRRSTSEVVDPWAN